MKQKINILISVLLIPLFIAVYVSGVAIEGNRHLIKMHEVLAVVLAILIVFHLIGHWKIFIVRIKQALRKK